MLCSYTCPRTNCQSKVPRERENSVYPDYDIYFTINILLCRAFVEIDSPLARVFVAFYSMINSIVIFCVTMVIQSCLRKGYHSKRDSEMLKTRFKKRVAFVQSLFPKRVIKTRFAIFNKVSFAVLSNLVCIVILFVIVTLIFPHRLRVCNAIYVEHRVVYIVDQKRCEQVSY